MIIISMRNHNHIIIPVLKNKPAHQQLNVFQNTHLSLHNLIAPPISRSLLDRTCPSAFKRYKLKKERKHQKLEAGVEQQANCIAILPQRPLKMKIIYVPAQVINKNIFDLYDRIPPPVFFDPNEAPLYSPNPQQHSTPSNNQHIPAKRVERIDEEVEIQVQQKMKIEPMEFEPLQRYLQLPSHQDDPFLIFKRLHPKKHQPRNHHHKTKNIKKLFAYSHHQITQSFDNYEMEDINKSKKREVQQNENEEKQLKLHLESLHNSFEDAKIQQTKSIDSLNIYLTNLQGHNAQCLFKNNEPNIKIVQCKAPSDLPTDHLK